MYIYKITNKTTGDETYYETGMLAEQVLKEYQEKFPDIEFELDEYDVVEDHVNSRESLLDWSRERLVNDPRVRRKLMEELDELFNNFDIY